MINYFVIEKHVCYLVGYDILVLKGYHSTYCLKQGSCFICIDLYFTSKLESQPFKI